MVSGGERAVVRCDALGVAPYSDTADGLYRGYLTPAHAAALDALADWMVEAGMTVRRDDAASLIGRYDGVDAAMPPLVIGSHIDSVRDAGRYDGPLGIMLGIECVAALHAGGLRMPFAIEVIAFGDEEGSRFPAAMLTSRAVAGTLAADALDIADADGVSVGEALAGWGLDHRRYLDAVHGPALAYLEAHIEQGPVLEALGLPVGVVTGIAAQLRYRLNVTGMAGHAGTTTMPLRRDALTAAAEMVLAAERIAGAAGDVVATVGTLAVGPGAANVIPGHVGFTLDVRSADPARRDTVADMILAASGDIADRRGVDLDAALIHDLPASPCDPALMDMLADAVQDVGFAAHRLVSGAGHDAMVMAAIAPTAMLFIRCAGGVSHNPAESVDPADVDVALQAMLGFIERLGSCR